MSSPPGSDWGTPSSSEAPDCRSSPEADAGVPNALLTIAFGPGSEAFVREIDSVFVFNGRNWPCSNDDVVVFSNKGELERRAALRAAISDASARAQCLAEATSLLRTAATRFAITCKWSTARGSHSRSAATAAKYRTDFEERTYAYERDLAAWFWKSCEAWVTVMGEQGFQLGEELESLVPVEIGSALIAYQDRLNQDWFAATSELCSVLGAMGVETGMKGQTEPHAAFQDQMREQ